MTIVVYEFGAVDASGNPIFPPSKVTRGVALAADHTCDKTAKAIQVVSTTDVRVAVGSTPTAGDQLLLAGDVATFQLPGAKGGVAVTVHAVTASLAATSASTVAVAIAASATTDGMDITLTAKDANGDTVAAVHQLEFWMSESSAGVGLTADAYSGDLTATAGAILSAHTAKKHWSVATAATGIFAATLVDSANPTDQYVAVKKPLGASLAVSGASGTNWQGAA